MALTTGDQEPLLAASKRERGCTGQLAGRAGPHPTRWLNGRRLNLRWIRTQTQSPSPPGLVALGGPRPVQPTA